VAVVKARLLAASPAPYPTMLSFDNLPEDWIGGFVVVELMKGSFTRAASG
jgi:hypothetical protein